MSSTRIVILTNGNFFARIILQDLFENRASDVAGVIITTGQLGKQEGLRTLWKLLRKCGWRYFLYKASTYGVFMLAKRLFRRRIFFVDQLARSVGVPILRTNDVNGPVVETRLREWSPDILVSVSCNQRVRDNILEISSLANLNIHSSLLPTYAGLAPYYWVLVNDELETGTTVHYMEKDFDTGNIICQRRVPIYPDDTVFALFYRLSLIGGSLLVEALACVEQACAGAVQDLSRRSYFSWPNARSSARLAKNGRRLVIFRDFLDTIFRKDRYRESQLTRAQFHLPG